MNNKFDQIEAHLQALFEESLPRFFTGKKRQHGLVDKLVQAIKSSEQVDEKGNHLAPDRFLLKISPGDLVEWKLHQDILDEIAVTLQEVGSTKGFSFLKAPKIDLQVDSQMGRDEFDVSAFFTPMENKLTDTVAIEPCEPIKEMIIPENAVLIVDGKEDFYLTKPVINIGRHSTNDLILKDPHISRHHAQLRAINNHFVIFDVGSVGGLFLNGRQVSQATLHAGDVLKIGMVTLIYNTEPTNIFSTKVIPLDKENLIQGEDMK